MTVALRYMKDGLATPNRKIKKAGLQGEAGVMSKVNTRQTQGLHLNGLLLTQPRSSFRLHTLRRVLRSSLVTVDSHSREDDEPHGNAADSKPGGR